MRSSLIKWMLPFSRRLALQGSPRRTMKQNEDGYPRDSFRLPSYNVADFTALTLSTRPKKTTATFFFKKKKFVRTLTTV